jgi:MoaA/NifB/PqqE/SkfB family radical SAM enzyme
MNDYIIKAVQIDVNGLCNAGCWFCPVSYEGNPKSAIRDMEISELENVFKQLRDGMGDFVDPDLKIIYSANYNEILLYKNLKQMFEIYRKYGFKTYILTNGVALKKEKVDLMSEYLDVVDGILLNIPAPEASRWSRYVKMNEKLFPKVVENINYAIKTLSHLTERGAITLMVNGVNDNSLTKNGGWLDILENAPETNLDVKDGTLAKDVAEFKVMFPDLKIYESFHLYDRAGHLSEARVLDQQPAINKYLKPKGSKVIGCNGGINVRSRTNEWVHINPNGDLFICCADYDFQTVYGNINNQTLKDIWNSKERSEMVTDSYSKMCTKCSAAIWGD